jgi:hypothetical protein
MLKTHHIVRRVASDLNALTRQNTKWKEADGLPKRSKEAFEAIKAALSSRPVMAYPKNNGRFYLYVDAALGDTKLPAKEEISKKVLFFAKKLS